MKFAAQNGNSKRGAKVGDLIMNSECRNEFNTEGTEGTEDTEKITNYELRIPNYELRITNYEL